MEEKGRKKIKIKPRHVVQYWADKYVNPDGAIITKDSPEYEFGKSIAIIPDLVEPICMACGKYWSIAEDYPNYEKDVHSDKWWKVWEYEHVRECYRKVNLIGDSELSDADVPDNTLLLCHSCYIMRPKYNEDFYAWLYEQRDVCGDEMSYLIYACNRYKSNYSNMDEFLKKCDTVEKVWKLISPYHDTAEIYDLAEDVFENGLSSSEAPIVCKNKIGGHTATSKRTDL